MSCVNIISLGLTRDCAAVKGQIGVDKELTLINYEDFDRAGTLAAANIEATDANKNVNGITVIKLFSGTVQYVFEGTDYSVKPTIAGEVKEDGDTWYSHSIAFMAYNKTSTARKVISELSQSKVIAVVKDRSTGFYELFGAEQGLKVSAVSREYVGNQNGNFYAITLSTPDIAGVKESNVGLLSHQAPVVAV